MYVHVHIMSAYSMWVAYESEPFSKHTHTHTQSQQTTHTIYTPTIQKFILFKEQCVRTYVPSVT